MPRHILLVESNPTGDRDDEFNAWYDGEHLPAVLEVPGFVAARRFVAAPSVHGELPERRYLAIYEIETDDLTAALKALSGAAREMHISEVFDHASHVTHAFTEIGNA